jgi:hypothetical protein
LEVENLREERDRLREGAVKAAAITEEPDLVSKFEKKFATFKSKMNNKLDVL